MSEASSPTPTPSTQFSIRRARPADLTTLLRLTLAGLGRRELADSVKPGDVHAFHTHTLRHGRLLVAVAGDRIAGYASTIERDDVRILSQVFVDERMRSSGIGRRLVDEIDPPDGVTRLLVASADERASALYIRRGCVPAWPVYTLTMTAAALECLPAGAVNVEPAEISDELVELDATISGRSRRDDFAFWAGSGGGTPYLVTLNGETAGVGWIHDPRSGAMSKWYDEEAAVHVGPVGTLSPRDARDGVLAILAAVRQAFPGRGASIEIGGPHPALPELLRAGGRLVDAETFMSNVPNRFGTPDRYVPSGGVLY